MGKGGSAWAARVWSRRPPSSTQLGGAEPSAASPSVSSPSAVRRNRADADPQINKIVSMYTQGMRPQEIAATLRRQTGPTLSERSVVEALEQQAHDAAAWRRRRLDPLYVAVTFAELPITIHDGGARMAKVIVAIGLCDSGDRDVLGFWAASHWSLEALADIPSELKRRGVKDMLIAMLGEEGALATALSAAFPQTTILASVSALVHDRSDMTPKERRRHAKALKDLIVDSDEPPAPSSHPGARPTPPAHGYWRDLQTIIALPKVIRRILYIDAQDALNSKLQRRALKIPAHFANEEDAYRLLALALRAAAVGWRLAPKAWEAAKGDLERLFGKRTVVR